MRYKVSDWHVFHAAACVVAIAPAARAQCGFDWAQGFGLSGPNGSVRAMAVFDDGNGPALYIGGGFTAVGEVPTGGIARWDGIEWSKAGSQTFADVHCLATLDLGEGPALFAGGIMGGANCVARWNGADWTTLGSPMSAPIKALAVFDDGNGWGPALYAGGRFTDPGTHIVRWDGAAWSTVGGGVYGPPSAIAPEVNAMTVFDDDGGGPNPPALLVTGAFGHAGGLAVNNIAKWNGRAWSALGSGLIYENDPPSTRVFDMAVFDADGDGPGEPALHVCGSFTSAGGAAASYIASWDGSTWSPLGGGLGGPALVIKPVYDRRLGGPALFAGGYFTTAEGQPAKRLAQWDGASWTGFSPGLGGPSVGTQVESIEVFEKLSSDEPSLFVGGSFTNAGTVETQNLARWDGQAWWSATGGSGLDHRIHALMYFDDGEKQKLYAGGAATSESELKCFDGTHWAPVGNLSGVLLSLAVFDDGTGSAIYSGGAFLVGGTIVGVAKWEAEWSPVGTNGRYVRALTVHDDGHEPALYAGGEFFSIGGVPAPFIAKWDGSAWSSLADGMNRNVYALASFDDGNGPALFAGGAFTTAGGVPARRVAKWDGTEWAPLGEGIGPGSTSGQIYVYALAVFDDGSGPALYAAGAFSFSGLTQVNNIAKWDGATWSPLGDGMPFRQSVPSVRALAVFDDGRGPALYAGGAFETAGDVQVGNIARWDGSVWTSLTSGISSVDPPFVHSMVVSPKGDSLYLGGSFTQAGGLSSNNIAQWTAVDQAPEVLQQPEDQTADLGAAATFSVAAWGGDLTYQWRRNRTPLVDGEHVAGANKTSLVISSVSGEDAGDYDVLVESACGSVLSDAASLAVVCQFDLAPPDGDGQVNMQDVLMVVANWATAGADGADVNGDGVVSVPDLVAVLGAWGPCP